MLAELDAEAAKTEAAKAAKKAESKKLVEVEVKREEALAAAMDEMLFDLEGAMTERDSRMGVQVNRAPKRPLPESGDDSWPSLAAAPPPASACAADAAAAAASDTSE